MSELSNFLVESILGESAEMENVIVVYSGRFQPFHKGHFATYKQLISKFGKDSVYIATSNKTDNQKSPFDFREKKTIITKMFGIPSNKIVQVKNPYQPTEILSSYDAAKTGLIVVVGEKDEQRLGGKYFTPYKGKVEMGYLDKGYVYASPSQSNPISGTDVRNWLSKGTEEEKKEGFLKAYPKFDPTIFKFITLKLAKLSEDINLDVNVGDTLLMGKFKNKKVVVKDIGKDEHGMPTINGKKATTFRIPTNESSNYGMSGAEPGEPNPNYVADGQKRILDRGKPEAWFKQGGYTQLDIPKGDWMRGKGRNKEKESTFRKVTYKLKNYKESELNPAKDPHTVEDWQETEPKKKIKKPKRFWEDTEIDTKLSLISEEELNEIAEEYITALDEMGLPGGAGIGLSLPGGYINGAPTAKDVSKTKKKLDADDNDEYEPIEEASGNGAFYNDGNATTGTMWNADWDDYNNAEYYLDNLEGWCFYHEDPSEYEKKKAVDQKLPTDDQNDGKTDKYNRILKYNFPKPEDLTEMAEMAKSDLDQVEKYADQQLSPEDVELGRESDHFFQRLNDPRNGKQISAAELTGFFKRLAKNKKKFLEFVKQYKEFVVKDNRTKINIPFMTVANKLIAKTIMRKDDFKSSTPVYVSEQSLSEITKGIYGKKLKINGEVVELEVELLGADNKTNEFITKVVYIDKKYQNKFPIGSTLRVPARVFRLPGGGWYKVKNKAFEAITSKNHKADGTADHNFTQHHKSSTYTPDYGYPAELDTIDFDDDREIEPGHQTDTKDTQNKGYEPVKKVNENLLVENSIVDLITLSTFAAVLGWGVGTVAGELMNRGLDWWDEYKDNKNITKIINRLKGDPEVQQFVKNRNKTGWREMLKNKLSPNEMNYIRKLYKDSFRESVNESLLTEGGAYGHMHHPFDTDMNLTFADLKNIVKKALTGDLELAREKTDGQALAISWVNGRLVAARNKSHLKDKGKGAMTISDLASKFAGRGELTDAYNFAMRDLSVAIGKLSEPQKEKIFKGGSCFMNLEVIYPTSVNVIPYGQPLLVFHGTFEYNEAGDIVGENQQAATTLADMIKKVNANVQQKYTIQGPPVQKLPQSQTLTNKQGKYFAMISKLQNEFGLKDTDGVADYHQAWWSNYIDKNSKGLTKDQKEGLIKRWAFNDKGFRIASIEDTTLRAWADKIEKTDLAKISKENTIKFEEIFLGVGADVLSFMESVLTADPKAARKEILGNLKQTIADIRKGGDQRQIDKLELELKRIQKIGGLKEIVPIEGLVFVYNGNTFKLTGKFAVINQILGIFKFAR